MVSILYSIVVTYIIFKVVDKTVGVRVDKRAASSVCFSTSTSMARVLTATDFCNI